MKSRLPTEERQAEIVAAALELARDTSPALITTHDIAAAVGVTQGAVFKHFPTKDAIWVAAMGWVQTTLLRTLTDAAQGQATALDQLVAIFRAHVAFVVAHPGVPRVLFQALQQPSDSLIKQGVRAVLQGYHKLLLSVLARAVAQGEVPADLDQEAAAILFVGIIQGLVMQSMLGPRPGNVRAQAERVLVLYLRGLGGAAR